MSNIFFGPGSDMYSRLVSVQVENTGEMAKFSKGHQICTIEQGVGHCCAASMLGNLSCHGFWKDADKVESFLERLRNLWKKQDCFFSPDHRQQLSVFVISGFYVLLSPETESYDCALRNHPKIKKVHEFYSRRQGPNEELGNLISLYFMEF